jgi:hypothetical protein
MRGLATVLILLALPAPSYAAECSAALRDQWTAAASRMARMNQQALREGNMRIPWDKANLCNATREMPEFIRLGNEYFGACDPIGRDREMPRIEYLGTIFAAYYQAHCKK